MVVKTHSKSRGKTGLDVGVSNVERYFSPGTRAIELQLGHLEIQCELPPDFWHGRPEIYDPRLCAWLEAKQWCGGIGQAPVSLSLIPSGKNSFRLAPAPPPAKSKAAPASERLPAVV